VDFQQSPYAGQQRGIVAADLFELVGSYRSFLDLTCNVENRFFVKLSADHGSAFCWVGEFSSSDTYAKSSRPDPNGFRKKSGNSIARHF
jgi:hypothetical protein